jgi:thioredoxin-related protein
MRKLSLETVANIAVIIVAIIVGTLLIKNNFFKPASNENSLVGQTLSLSEVNLKATKFTLVLALSTRCRFCDQSIPFYQRLVSLKRETGASFQTVGAFRESSEAAREYLSGKGLNLDAVVGGPQGNLNVEGTPTLLLINGEGKVVQEWVGFLNETGQREVIAKLTAG